MSLQKWSGDCPRNSPATSVLKPEGGNANAQRRALSCYVSLGSRGLLLACLLKEKVMLGLLLWTVLAFVVVLTILI